MNAAVLQNNRVINVIVILPEHMAEYQATLPDGVTLIPTDAGGIGNVYDPATGTFSEPSA